MLKFKWETKFRETGIGYEIPNEWGIDYLRNAIRSLESGKRPKRGKLNYTPDGVLNIGGENISWQGELLLEDCFRVKEDFYNGVKKGGVEQEDILLVKDGATIGKLHFVSKIPETKAMVNEHVFLLKVNKSKYVPRLLFYYLFSQVGQRLIENSVGGSAQGGINRSILDTIVIPILDTTEQSHIAAVLSWFDDLIENKKKQNKILQKTAMAIFKSWFIDFEPFKHQKFVDSELGEIPEDWKIDRTTRTIEFNPKVNLIKGQVYSFVEMKGVSVNSMVCGYDPKEYGGSGAKFGGGDTLLARITPCLENEKSALVWFLDNNHSGFGTTEFIVMRPKEKYLEEFVYLLATTEDFREHAINSMTGSTGRQRVEKEALEAFKIPIPPRSILRKFHSIVESVFQKVIINQKQILALRRIRDALLPLLVFGKLRVEEV